MLKSHKQNLVPESEFHIREERVKAQKTDVDTTTTTSTKPAPTPPAEKEKRGEKRERERENGALAAPPEEAPQKTPKMKGAATAAEAKAAAEREQQAKEEQQVKEKEQQVKGKEQQAKGKEPQAKGEESKNSEAPSEGVAVSTPNSEPPLAARRDGKGGNSSATPNAKLKAVDKGSKSAENGKSNNHAKKAEGKTEGEKLTGGEGKKNQAGESVGRRSGSKERPTSVERTPKNKPKASAEKSDETATPASKMGTSVSAAARSSSPATRGARAAQNSSQNGPMGATPSPTRAGQRRQVSEMEGTSDVVPEKGEFRCSASWERNVAQQLLNTPSTRYYSEKRF